MAKKHHTESKTPSSIEIMVGPLTASVPLRYAEGHVLTSDEANALDQLVRENLRNTFRPTVQKVLEAAKAEGREALSDEEKADLLAKFNEKVAAYSFSSARGPRAPVDPVGKEAYKMAKALVVGAIQQKKIDLKTVPAEKIDALVKDLLAKRPAIREEAERRVAQAKAFANAALDLE